MSTFPLSLLRAWMTGRKETADRICGHELFILSEGPRQFGKHVDWNYGASRDIKIPWELSRFQFLPTLARAYEIHHDEKYAEAARELIADWIAKNPIGRGLHFRVAMEAAIRACNWILAWEFLKNAPSWKDAGFQKNFLSALQAHGDFIFQNLENKKFFTTNHYVADLVGLFFLGVLFPEFEGAAAWKNFAQTELEKEMMRQVYEDGVYYEASIPYHRLACEFFGFCALLARENGAEFSGKFLERLELMFEFSKAYTKPNGLAPQIGDGDDGRLFLLEDYFEWNPRDHRHLMYLANSLFPLNTKFVRREKKDGEGENGEAEAKNTSVKFEKGGIYIFRKDDFYCLADCGGNGQNGNGGHCHSDTLSFELSAGGEDFIIDPGTYMYTGNPSERRRFRSTRMHNTAMVDEKEQNRFRLLRLFGVKNDCVPKVNRWENTEKSTLLDAQHSAYERLSAPVIHRRIFTFDTISKKLEITDSVLHSAASAQRERAGRERIWLRQSERGRAYTIEWNWHFSPHTKISMKNENTYLLDKNGVKITLEIPPELRPRAYIRWDFVSPRYGVKIEAPVLTIKKYVTLEHEHSFCFTILPA